MNKLKSSQFKRTLAVSFFLLVLAGPVCSQFNCTTYNIYPVVTITATPTTAVYGQPTILTATFSYSSQQAYYNYIEVGVPSIGFTGGPFTVISSTSNSLTISVNPISTTTYTALAAYNIVRESEPTFIQVARGCTVTSAHTITLPPPVTITSGSHHLICGNVTPQTYTCNTFPGALSYMWTWPAGWSGPSSTSTNTATATPNGTTGGLVTVSITVNGLSQTSPPYAVAVTTPSLSISGPSLVCSNASFFSNIPTGFTLSWVSSNSSGLSINSSGTATRLNNFNGPVSIIASANSNGLCYITSTKDIWVGDPIINYVAPGRNPCLQNPYYYGPSGIAGLSYQWTVDNSNVWFTSGSNSLNATVISNNPEYFNISLTISDGNCTSSSTLSSYTAGYYCLCFSDPSCEGGLGLFTISPNPAGEEISISAKDFGERIAPNSGSYSMTLINDKGKVIETVETKNKNFKWDTSKIPAGSYYLKVKYNDLIETTRILIEH